MNLRAKYVILKATTIVLGALSIPWSTFVGFSFGEGRYFIGAVALCAQTVVALVDGYIWFWVLENMRDKMQKETAMQYHKSINEESELRPFPADNSLAIHSPGELAVNKKVQR